MPNFDLRVGGTTKGAAPAFRNFEFERRIDYRRMPVVAADTVQLLNIAPGTLVLGASVQVHRVQGATCTQDVGDGAAATHYLSNANLNALGITGSPITAAKFYPTADVLTLTCDHNINEADVTYRAVGFLLGPL